MASTKSKTSCSKKLEKLKTPPLQGPLSRAFSRSALCNVRSLTSPPIGDLGSSLSTGDLGSSLSTSDLGSSLPPATSAHLFPPATSGSPHVTRDYNDCSNLQALSTIKVCFCLHDRPYLYLDTSQQQSSTCSADRCPPHLQILAFPWSIS
ncbi:unnamed protein product [Lactuca saligna]|uniref:Uncharacterized protein n=1 Tax=Lactuca saligna TaxID=75948 RepID=A0AA35YL45_LACSI|nr:unnamed protein product [Lactuca saligna]